MLSFALFTLCALAQGSLATEVAQLRLSETDLLKELSDRVEGRLYAGVPFAQPCWSNFKSSTCESIKKNYLNETSRFDTLGGYINTQWETCQATGQQCLLDWEDPLNPAPPSSETCQLGSISDHYIDVRRAADVAAAFDFSRKSGRPIIVKNTGHDYKGRSSAPGSVALWTHNLKNISYDAQFVPEGCVRPYPGVTMGAGIQWGDAYEFAEAHNITLVGGLDKGVGTSGGWLMGGGHGALTNTMGMGVDRVLQFKVVTPDGELRVANACQNEDLFFALRGGGGGTYGVVLESTTLASPPVTLQVYVVQWTNSNATLTSGLWSVLVENGLKWAEEGWGGFVDDKSAIYISPNLDTVRANASMSPLIAFGEQVVKDGIEGATLLVLQFPSWGTFFNTFAGDNSAAIGVNLALASRLIPKANFRTAENRSDLLLALLKSHDLTPGLRFLMSPPTSYPGDGSTSVTPAWRDSVYHITLISTWNWNATAVEKKAQYDLSSRAISYLRAITPDAAYSNEADVYEPNHEVAFWGNNYERLLQIKRKYDPEQLLDCWHCVGWNPNSRRFACYL
ncbi:FAD-binding domain-containing protein [Neolentinus lepideus HHB14362 ss-1]|uniref:FAD-binding domain-containing protein n=1 Tax=Neolentinus lepideus HHB14362 ss-1 TaxID=1314782 RepID=A0A165SNG7_9AGAM|nr:FAD-binding domain-containing protein [Neolentinus lepideus HHB14362 ss-1]